MLLVFRYHNRAVRHLALLATVLVPSPFPYCSHDLDPCRVSHRQSHPSMTDQQKDDKRYRVHYPLFNIPKLDSALHLPVGRAHLQWILMRGRRTGLCPHLPRWVRRGSRTSSVERLHRILDHAKLHPLHPLLHLRPRSQRRRVCDHTKLPPIQRVNFLAWWCSQTLYKRHQSCPLAGAYYPCAESPHGRLALHRLKRM